jgi:hypothetical protein
MAAIVSQERARGTYLTAAVGLLVLAAAIAMMFAAAPRLDHHLATGHLATGHLATGHAAAGHAAAGHTAAQLTAQLSHQVAFSSDSASTRACLAGPRALRACAEAYTPSMASDS